MALTKDTRDLYTEQELKALERIQSLIGKAYSHSQKYFEDRSRFRARYRNEMGIEKADWQADIAHPLPHLAAVRKASFCADAVLGSAGRPIFRVLPWDNLNAARKAQAHTMFIRQQQSQMPLTEILYNTFLSTFIDGTSILHTFWDSQIEIHEKNPEPKIVQVEKPILNPMNGQPLVNPYTGEPVVERKLELKQMQDPPDVIVRADRPGILQVDINDFWPDPMATSINNAQFHCYRKFMKLSQLQQFVKFGRFDAKKVEAIKGTYIPRRDFNEGSAKKYGKYSTYKQMYNERVYEYANIDPDDPTVEIIEFYEPGKVSVLVNNEILIDLNRCIYRSKYPFVRFANLCENKEFFGLSEFQVPEKLLDSVNQMQNMIFDNWEKHLKGITLIDSSVSEMAKQELLEGNPGAVIRINDLNGLKTERPELMDNSVIAGMEILLQEVKDSLSIDGAISGASPGSEVRDSQSFEIFTRISQVTLSILTRRISESMRDLGRQWVNLNKQFLSMPFKIKLAGANALDTEKGEDMIIDPNNPADFPSDLDVDVQLSTIADSRIDKELKRMAEFINLGGQIPTFKADEAMLEMGSKIDAFSDPLNLFETDPNEIIKRASLQAFSAGKKSPALAGRLQVQSPNGGGSPALGNQGGGAPLAGGG